jgi:hypothetical protein
MTWHGPVLWLALLCNTSDIRCADTLVDVAAVAPGGVVLWDCRAASRAVAELPTAGQVQLMQAMPGGTVLLTAAADGQVGGVAAQHARLLAAHVLWLLLCFHVSAAATACSATANENMSPWLA